MRVNVRMGRRSKNYLDSREDTSHADGFGGELSTMIPICFRQITTMVEFEFYSWEIEGF